LPPDAFASRMAQLYGDLDHVHSSHVMLTCKWLRALTPAGGRDPFC
jgi:hypothetical protein